MSGEGERVNYDDSRLERSALSFRHGKPCHLPPHGGLVLLRSNALDDGHTMPSLEREGGPQSSRRKPWLG